MTTTELRTHLSLDNDEPETVPWSYPRSAPSEPCPGSADSVTGTPRGLHEPADGF
ncbi:MAG: hypothetical protein ACI80N_003848 [Gammaproteobacteria bacterium]|jgi:hypothetical protein